MVGDELGERVGHLRARGERQERALGAGRVAVLERLTGARRRLLDALAVARAAAKELDEERAEVEEQEREREQRGREHGDAQRVREMEEQVLDS